MFQTVALLTFMCLPALAAKTPPAKLMRMANSGDSQAQDKLGMWYDDNGYGKTAVKWYRKAAAQGHSGALHHMGVMLEGGAEASGVAQDCAASWDYYQKAIEKGNPSSIFRVGYQYYRGVCTSQNYTQARDWFKKSETAMGLFYIGLMNEHGQGRPADLASAARLYEQAFRGGVVRAANQLAHLYYDGATRDAVKAYVWYLRGANEADKQDRMRLASLKQELSSDERRRAEREAKSL